ncbi:cobyrinic acid a,c-diamide synthase [marine bacterium AO1-C]|nr:cobyrinic acid a,c-diamide synthase [marine bacterium AO1-C]
MNKTQFIIAAPSSNGGKTTFTLGILRALQKRGISTQPFKAGPDYIDPKFHELACGKTGINLDIFMMGEEHIRETYAHYIQKSQVACVEGVMGLFDGAIKAQGSTAQLAKLLKLPVILVVDAKATAYSVAPLLYGFKNFDPTIDIAGVIFNRVNTSSHYQFLVDACQDVGVTPLGHLPFLENCTIPSRHLGLSLAEIDKYQATIDNLAIALEKYVDIDKLLEVCQRPTKPVNDYSVTEASDANFTTAVAKDEAFNFCYPQNIRALKRKGKVVFFSPLRDSKIPEANLIYLPGGYPEYYLEALSKNVSMQKSIYEYANSSGKIIAECGGLMYLGQAIIDKEGKTHPMTHVFDFKTSMEQMKLHLGYRHIQVQELELKGHEFHYSNMIESKNTPTIGTITNARNQAVKTFMYQYKSVLASYVHLYFGTDQLLEIVLNLRKQSSLNQISNSQ